MRVVVANVTSGGLSGGAKKYIAEVMPRLAKNPNVKDLTVFVPQAALSTFGNGEFRAEAWPDTDPQKQFVGLRERIKSIDPDVVFIPTSRVIETGLPTVSMFRNMEPPTIPFFANPIRESIKNVFRNRVAKSSIHRSDAVITVSEYVRTFLIENWRITPEKLHTVYHGISNPSTKTKCPAALIHLTPNRPLIFTAGSIRPARGLIDLCNALPWLSESFSDDKPVIAIAGGIDPGMEAHASKLKKTIRKFGWEPHVVWTGKLTPEEMQWCYQRCSAMLMTSRAEACPNTVLEAMAAGCINVSTTQRPMPEFFQEAAFYYQPLNARELAQALRQSLSLSASERERRRVQSRELVKRFTWDDTVNATLRVLNQVIEQSTSQPDTKVLKFKSTAA